MKNKLLMFGLLLCVPLVWNFLQPHFFHLHDFTHVARLAELERGVLEGQLPVRWSQNLGYGYGMPEYSFYGPLFYFEALIFRIFQISFVWSIKLTVVLQVLISFWALYKLGELLWGEWGGLLTGIAGIYAPYRLVDMYVRGAFAELSGMTFFALALYMIVCWSKKPSWRGTVLIASSWAGIILSHTLMALITAPFILLWLGYWSVQEKKLTGYWRQVLMMVTLAFGLSAFFSLPALLEKGFTQVEQLTSGFSNYGHHFLYIRQLWQSRWGYGGSIWGIDDNVSFELGKVQLIVLAIILLLFHGRDKRSRNNLVFIFGCLGISLFVTILKAKPLWDLLPIMAYVQFPWRYLSVSIIFIALLVGSLGSLLSKRLVAPVSIGVVLLIVGFQINRARPEKFLDNDSVLYYSDPVSIKTQMSGIIPDFLPKKAEPKNLSPLVDENIRFEFSPGIRAQVEVNRAHEFLLSLPPTPLMQFTANIFDFPGWTLYLNGQELPHTTSVNGLIQAEIPVQRQDSFLAGRFKETPLRILADGLTVLSILVTIGLSTL